MGGSGKGAKGSGDSNKALKLTKVVTGGSVVAAEKQAAICNTSAIFVVDNDDDDNDDDGDTMEHPMETKWMAIRCWVKCDVDGTPVRPFVCAGPQATTSMPGQGMSCLRGRHQDTLDKYIKPGWSRELLPIKNKANAESALATQSPPAGTSSTTADEMMAHMRSMLE